MGHKIDNLVTLGTPIRSDYKPNTNAIGNHINVYSQYDDVQKGGGFSNTTISVFGSRMPVHMEMGPAGQRLGSATNIEAGLPDLGPIQTHSALWQNESVWRKVEPLLKK